MKYSWSFTMLFFGQIRGGSMTEQKRSPFCKELFHQTRSLQQQTECIEVKLKSIEPFWRSWKCEKLTYRRLYDKSSLLPSCIFVRSSLQLCALSMPGQTIAHWRIYPKNNNTCKGPWVLDLIPTKFHQNPSSGSGEEVENVNSLMPSSH